MDEDGFVYVTDRLKDMIVTGGENVSSSEVESVLARHPGVLQAAVIAAPDATWGERVHAVVSVRPGDPLTEEELIEFCRMSMSGFKRPRSAEIRQTPLPMSAVGKIRKDLLRQELKSREEARHD
jgi:long-chain acyl-CoA synthetase